MLPRTVQVFNRFEIGKEGRQFHVDMDVNSVAVLPALTSAFLGEREDIRITFLCEYCGAEPMLTLVWERGPTFVRWAQQFDTEEGTKFHHCKESDRRNAVIYVDEDGDWVLSTDGGDPMLIRFCPFCSLKLFDGLFEAE